MGRLFRLVGILLIFGSVCVAPIYFSSQVSNMEQQLAQMETELEALDIESLVRNIEASICNEGETLKTGDTNFSFEDGSFSFNAEDGAYCVNLNNGVQRNVTVDFSTQLFGEIAQFFPPVLIGIGLSVGACLLGGVLWFLGALMGIGRRGRGRTIVVQGGRPVDAPVGSAPRKRTPSEASAESDLFNPSPLGDLMGDSSTGSVKDRLGQLEELKRAGLITEEEYQRRRRDILNSI